MELIKDNIQKKRAVFLKDSDTIRKFWYDKDPQWIQQHVEILNKVQPGYVKYVGENYVDFTRYLGQPANKIKHTPEFRDEICKFCVDQINSTLPYAHGDWVLSNIIIDGNTMRMVDWDNVGIYDTKSIHTKLKADLQSAFGELFDPTSI
jgi:hypothetical protein